MSLKFHIHQINSGLISIFQYLILKSAKICVNYFIFKWRIKTFFVLFTSPSINNLFLNTNKFAFANKEKKYMLTFLVYKNNY